MVGLKDFSDAADECSDEQTGGLTEGNQSINDVSESEYGSFYEEELDEEEDYGAEIDEQVVEYTEHSPDEDEGEDEEPAGLDDTESTHTGNHSEQEPMNYSNEETDGDEDVYNEIPPNVSDDEHPLDNACEAADNRSMHVNSDGQKIWIPNVPDEKRPKLGQVFGSIEEGEEFYRNYADVAGFEIRKAIRKKGANNIITNRYVMCNREGIPKNRVFDTSVHEPRKRKRRNTNFKRCGCKAIFKIKYVPTDGNYVLHYLVEQHNHRLLSQEEMLFSKNQRQLTYQEQKNVFLSVSAKIGTSKAHRMRKAMNRGLLGPGGTLRDYQNYKRDIDNFVGNRDAQMLIDKLYNRKKACPEYYFEYKCSDKELDILFWADETARLNYKEFGDVISFDSTFRSNQHAMVFVPFVAIDNHFRTVVVGAALMRQENKEDYQWLLNAFMRVHRKQPKFVITDQCPAMRQAIPKVFTNSRHRFCLWHIMDKVSVKVGVNIANNTTFIKEINDMVWNVNLDPEDFESQWSTLMNKYGLANHKWFSYMYKIRKHWIPAYYKDFPMSGLMKTSSRSESVNAFFCVFKAFHDNLVFFLKSFDDAIELQRNKHVAIELKTKQTTPRVVSPTKIEIHASKIYTRTLFFEVQEEINFAVWGCEVDHVHVVGDTKHYTISEAISGSDKILIYKVVYNVTNVTVDCSCNFFIRNGYLCRHAFKVLLNSRFDVIPEKYVLRRWTRDIIPIQWLPAVVRYGEVDEEQEKMIAKMTLITEQIIGYVKHDKRTLGKVLEQMEDIRSSVIVDHPVRATKETRTENIKEFLAVSEPESVDIMPPTGIRNKGCGTGKRLKSTREKERDKTKKMKRKCKSCHKVARHDSRNCPDKAKVK